MNERQRDKEADRQTDRQAVTKREREKEGGRTQTGVVTISVCTHHDSHEIH